ESARNTSLTSAHFGNTLLDGPIIRSPCARWRIANISRSGGRRAFTLNSNRSRPALFLLQVGCACQVRQVPACGIQGGEHFHLRHVAAVLEVLSLQQVGSLVDDAALDSRVLFDVVGEL